MAAHNVLFQLHKKLNEKKEKEVLEDAFRRADLNGDGRLSVQEIFTIFQAHDVPVTVEEISEIVSEADKDGTGQLTIQEFANNPRAVETVQEGQNEEDKKMEPPKSPGPQRKGEAGSDRLDKAEMAFKLYDKDKDGYITKAEMTKLSKTLTKEQIDKAFKRFDSDGDGRLSYNEFKKMMHK